MWHQKNLTLCPLCSLSAALQGSPVLRSRDSGSGELEPGGQHPGGRLSLLSGPRGPGCCLGTPSKHKCSQRPPHRHQERWFPGCGGLRQGPPPGRLTAASLTPPSSGSCKPEPAVSVGPRSLPRPGPGLWWGPAVLADPQPLGPQDFFPASRRPSPGGLRTRTAAVVGLRPALTRSNRVLTTVSCKFSPFR